ncbi:MAG: hypothetical protein WBI53_11230 [Paludibacter sp.]
MKNDSVPLTKEMKVLFLQMLKQSEMTKADAEGLVKIFVENGLIQSPTQIVFRNFDNSEEE